jgi:hypothetical protein
MVYKRFIFFSKIYYKMEETSVSKDLIRLSMKRSILKGIWRDAYATISKKLTSVRDGYKKLFEKIDKKHKAVAVARNLIQHYLKSIMRRGDALPDDIQTILQKIVGLVLGHYLGFSDILDTFNFDNEADVLQFGRAIVDGIDNRDRESDAQDKVKKAAKKKEAKMKRAATKQAKQDAKLKAEAKSSDEEVGPGQSPQKVKSGSDPVSARLKSSVAHTKAVERLEKIKNKAVVRKFKSMLSKKDPFEMTPAELQADTTVMRSLTTLHDKLQQSEGQAVADRKVLEGDFADDFTLIPETIGPGAEVPGGDARAARQQKRDDKQRKRKEKQQKRGERKTTREARELPPLPVPLREVFSPPKHPSLKNLPPEEKETLARAEDALRVSAARQMQINKRRSPPRQAGPARIDIRDEGDILASGQPAPRIREDNVEVVMDLFNIPNRLAQLVAAETLPSGGAGDGGPNIPPKAIKDIEDDIESQAAPKIKKAVHDIEDQIPEGRVPEAIQEANRLQRFARQAGGAITVAAAAALAAKIVKTPDGGPPGDDDPLPDGDGDIPDDIDIPIVRNLRLLDKITAGALTNKIRQIIAKYKERKDATPSEGQLADIREVLGNMTPPNETTLQKIDKELGTYQKHFPGYNYLGPDTNIEQKLRGISQGSNIPVNKLDDIAMRHDIQYRLQGSNARQRADKQMLESMSPLAKSDVDAQLAYGIIFLKHVLETRLGISFGQKLSGDPSITNTDAEIQAENDVADGLDDTIRALGIKIPDDNSATIIPDELNIDEAEQAVDKLNEKINIPDVDIQEMNALRKSFIDLNNFIQEDPNNINKISGRVSDIITNIEAVSGGDLSVTEALGQVRSTSSNPIAQLGVLYKHVVPALRQTSAFQSLPPRVAIETVRSMIITHRTAQNAYTAVQPENTTPLPPPPTPETTAPPTSTAQPTPAPTTPTPTPTAPTQDPTPKNGLFTSRPVERPKQVREAIEDSQNTQDFQKFRPELQTIQMDKVEDELAPLDDMEIKQETIDFNYTPVRGWRAEGNSIYEMSVIANNIRYKGKHLNHSGVGLVNRVGYNKPLHVSWPPEEAKDPSLNKLQKPMFVAGSLDRNVPFKLMEFSLNYDTQPIDTADVNLFRDHWQKSMYVPNAGRVPFEPVAPSTTKEMDEFDTEPKPKDSLMSSVGLGFSNFDGHVQ